MIVKPQVGDAVWYWPAPPDGIARHSGQPLAATIAAVESDNMVHLGVLAADGVNVGRTSVPLVQDADAPGGSYCEFRSDDMPALSAREGFSRSRTQERQDASTSAPAEDAAAGGAADGETSAAPAGDAAGGSTPNP